jgi:hypothetical protein
VGFDGFHDFLDTISQFAHLLFDKVTVVSTFFGIVSAKSQGGAVNAAKAEEVENSKQNYDLEG